MSPPRGEFGGNDPVCRTEGVIRPLLSPAVCTGGKEAGGQSVNSQKTSVKELEAKSAPCVVCSQDTVRGRVEVGDEPLGSLANELHAQLT